VKAPNCLTVMGTASRLSQPTTEPTVTVMDWGSKAPPETVTMVTGVDRVFVAVGVTVAEGVFVTVSDAVGEAVAVGVAWPSVTPLLTVGSLLPSAPPHPSRSRCLSGWP